MGHGLVPKAAGHGQDGGQVGGGLLQVQAADDVHIGVAVAQQQPAPLLQHRQQQGRPVIVDAVAHPPGVAQTAGHHQGLDLRQHRAHPLHHAGDAGARGVGGPPAEQGLGRIGHLGQAAVLHLEHADLVGGPKAVFGCPEDTIGHVPLPLKIEDAVHHVLQHLGSGDGTLFIHVADDEDGDALPLGQLHQGHGTLLHLAHTAGGGAHVPVVHGLD